MPASVPFVDLAGQHRDIRLELQAAFDRVVDASSFILGEEVEHFEAEFATYCGVRHCIGVGSGTAALTIAMKAAGIGRGDEVIVPAYTFVASALAVLHVGARPVFCDVEDGTGLIDADSAAAAVSSRTAAILPVHLYGQLADMGAVDALARRHGLAVIEDAAQAHGGTWSGQRAGSLGTASAFSFYPSKNLGALGDGGAICTDDDGLADRARMLRDLGRRTKDEHAVAGLNERLDGLQAAVLRVKLPHLDAWNTARRRAALEYRTVLEGAVRMLEERSESRCVFHVFPIRVADRDSLAAELADAGIATGVHYARAVPDQPVFADVPPDRADFEVAASWAREELSLPMHDQLEPATARRVGETVLERLTARAR